MMLGLNYLSVYLIISNIHSANEDLFSTAGKHCNYPILRNHKSLHRVISVKDKLDSNKFQSAVILFTEDSSMGVNR